MLLNMTPSDIDTPNSHINIVSMTEQIEFGTNVLFAEIHIIKEGRPAPDAFCPFLVEV